MKVSTLSVAVRVWQQVEPFSVQVWYHCNHNEADGHRNGKYSELKAVFERQNVA